MFSTLVILSIYTIKLSNRFGIPSLVLFLAIGMLAGSDGLGISRSTIHAGAVAGCHCAHLDSVFWWVGHGVVGDTPHRVAGGVALDDRGVDHCTTYWVFVAWVQGFSFLEGLLLGAIVSSTDAAAVFMVLRARRTKIPRRLIQLLEFSSAATIRWPSC